MKQDRSGTNHPQAKLDDAKVRDIRANHVRSGGTKRSIDFAEAYKVTCGTIDNAYKGVTWKHVH